MLIERYNSNIYVFLDVIYLQWIEGKSIHETKIADKSKVKWIYFFGNIKEESGLLARLISQLVY